jgi:uncharacterized protein YndB with AHSA1/START domain
MNVATRPLAELVLSRDLDAPRARVFAAWTDVSQTVLWWAPQDFVLLDCAMDLRPGGVWRRRMRAPDGAIVLKHGVYREIVPPERLVFTYNTEFSDGSVEPETLVTVTFAERDGRTRLTLRHTDFRTEASASAHGGGWTSCLARFAGFLAQERPR